jgi:hypothetical protein
MATLLRSQVTLQGCTPAMKRARFPAGDRGGVPEVELLRADPALFPVWGGDSTGIMAGSRFAPAGDAITVASAWMTPAGALCITLRLSVSMQCSTWFSGAFVGSSNNGAMLLDFSRSFAQSFVRSWLHRTE